MKKIFMVSLVAMMAVTAANADIASTSYVQARTGEMTIGADGKVTDANYAETDQDLKFIKNTDALNAAIGKLDAAIDDQRGELDVELEDYVKKAEANETKKGGTAGTFVYSVEQVEGDVAAEQGTFLSEITTEALSGPQIEAYKVAPQAGAVKSYVDTAVKDLETTQNKAIAITDGMDKSTMYPTVGLTEELISGANQDMSDLIGTVPQNTTVMDNVDAKVDDVQGVVTNGVSTEGKRLMATRKDGTVVAREIKKDTTDTTDGSFITGLSVNDDGNLVYTDGTVGTDDIEDGAVTTPKIADNAVTTPKILDKNVTKAKLSDDVQGSLDAADSAMQESALKGLTSWTDQKCDTTGVTCSLVSKSGVIAWEAVKY